MANVDKQLELELKSDVPPAIVKCENCGSTTWELVLIITGDEREMLLLRCSNDFCQAEQARKLGVSVEEAAWQCLDVSGQFDIGEIETVEEDEASTEDELLN